MQRISTRYATPGQQFSEGNKSTGLRATEVSADWLNATQEELASVVESLGGQLNPDDSSQIYKAINNAINQRIGVAKNELNQAISEAADTLNQSIDDAETRQIAADKKRWRVGSVYINADDNTNPASFFGFGTWTLTSKGQMIAGYDAGDASNTFRPIGKTGGERQHELTIAEMPAHSHGYQSPENGGFNGDGGAGAPKDTYTTEPTGGGQPHNNMPPYVVMYIWKRTA